MGQAPSAHEAHARRLAMVARRTINGVVISDVEGRIEWVNEGFTRITGYTLDEVIGHKPGHVLQGPATDRATVAEIRAHLDRHEGFTAELVNYRKNGEAYWVRVEVQPLFDDDGVFSGYMGLETDLSDLRRATEALQESEVRWRRMVERHPDAIFVVDEGRIVYANPEAVRLAGATSAADLLGRPGATLLSDESDEAQRLREGAVDWSEPVAPVEVPFQRLDGGRRYLEVASVPVVFEDRPAIQIVARDVTDRRDALAEVQRRARQEEAIARLGQRALETTDLEAVLQEAVQTVAAGMDLDRAALVEIVPDAQSVVVRAATGFDVPVGRLYPAPAAHPADDVLVFDHLGDALPVHERALLEAAGVGGGLRVAVRGVRGAFGYLGAYARTPLAHAEQDLPFLQAVAHVVASALARDRAEASLVAERNRAEELARAKSAFLANMSHEIRTPLTGIIGFASVLAGEVEGPHREFAQLIEQSGRRLLEVLNSVLDLARLEANQTDLELEVHSLAAETEPLLALWRPMVEQKGLALVAEVTPAGRMARARVDRAAFGRVLQNLISNAVKFTPEGAITLTLDADARHALVRVRDTGIGMDAAFLPRLFEEFAQETAGGTRAHAGTGLGLSITRRLVDMMGGTIGVESRKGEGTTFFLAFPLVVEAPAETAASEATMPRAEVPQTSRILIVDDNEDTLELMAHVLDGVCEVDLASDATQAIERARSRRYDLVLLDINLGTGPDGVAVRRALADLPAYRGVPVVALTAYALPGDREHFLEAGFTAYLSKPFDVDDLMRLITRLLRHSG